MKRFMRAVTMVLFAAMTPMFCLLGLSLIFGLLGGVLALALKAFFLQDYSVSVESQEWLAAFGILWMLYIIIFTINKIVIYSQINT